MVTGRVRSWLRFVFNVGQQQRFLRGLQAFLEHGLTIEQALSLFAQDSRGIRKYVAMDIARALDSSQSFAEAMQEWFSAPVIALIVAGEQNNMIAGSLDSAFEFLSLQKQMRSSVLQSFFYPLIILLAVLGVILGVEHLFLQQHYAESHHTFAWFSLNNQFLLFTALVCHYSWVIFLAGIAGALVFIRVFTHYIGGIRPILDKLPGIAGLRRVSAAYLLQYLGLLTSHGVQLSKALKVLQSKTSPYLALHLLTMEYRTHSGKDKITNILDTGLLDSDEIIQIKHIARVKGIEYAMLYHGRESLKRRQRAVHAVGFVAGDFVLVLAITWAVMLIRMLSGWHML